MVIFKSSLIELLLYICIVKGNRTIFFYKDFFGVFYRQQSWKVQKKILWTLSIVETVDRIPETYFKHIENTEGIYELRVQVGSNIFRVFCFFDNHNLVVVGHGFRKKTQKTPVSEIEKAERIKREYDEEKQFNKP